MGRYVLPLESFYVWETDSKHIIWVKCGEGYDGNKTRLVPACRELKVGGRESWHLKERTAE